MATRGALIVVAAFVAALAIRLAMTAGFQGLASPPNLSANPDQAEYEQLAFNLSRGHGYSVDGIRPTAVRPPGFALTLLPIYTVFGRSYLAARLTIIMLSALTCVLTGWIGYELGGWWVAVIAAWWLALYPGHFYYSMHFLSEPVAAFWLAAALVCTVRARRTGRMALSVLSGLCWGAAILTRVELLSVVPIGGVLLLAEPAAERRALVRQWMLQACIVAIVVTPWVVRNGVVMHAYTLSTQSGCTFWGAHNELTFASPRFAGTWVDCSRVADSSHPITGGEIERDHLTMSYGIESVRAHEGQLPYLAAMKLWRLVSPFFETTNRASLAAMAAGWTLTAPFVVWGIGALWRARGPARSIAIILSAPVVATIVTTVMFYGSPRYRDALSPILVIFATAGGIQAARVATQRMGQPAIANA